MDSKAKQSRLIRLVLIYALLIPILFASVYWLGGITDNRASGFLSTKDASGIATQLTTEFSIISLPILLPSLWWNTGKNRVRNAFVVSATFYVGSALLIYTAAFWADPAGLVLGHHTAPTFKVLSEWNWLSFILISLPPASICLGLLAYWLFRATDD